MIVRTVMAERLAVPLVDPFVIATARVDVTPSVLVRVELEHAGGVVTGIGEGACLPPVTKETPDDVFAHVARVGPELLGRRFDVPKVEAFADLVGGALDDAPVTRAALQVAFLDAFARAHHVHLTRLLAPSLRLPVEVVSDMTLPILPEARMVELALEWRARGFRTFKVKVGKDLDADTRVLLAVADRVQDARFRLDANEGFTPREALALAHACLRHGLTLECFEQPCARAAEGALEEVQAGIPEVPVIADESCRSEADLDRLLAAAPRVGGINLKLVKHGGLLEAHALGERARRAGLRVMVGGMVETRLGMGTAAALAACFPGVLADLDTAWLLTRDPFTGGYEAEGERYAVGRGEGHGVSFAEP
jgi:L-alanine-DL-glutamate epimerase-like enolase superfamily enzyme